MNFTAGMNDTGTINNTTTTTPNHIQYQPHLTTRDTVTIILFSLVSIIGVFGNTLVIYVYGFATQKRFLKFERLMLMLGIVDVIASITNPLLYMYKIVTYYRAWHFGVFGCKLLSSFGPISTSISLGIILIMAIDRDRAVSTPFKKQFTVCTIYKAVGVAVILSVLIVSPYANQLVVSEWGCGIGIDTGIWFLRLTVSIFLISDLLFILVLGITTVRVCMKLSQKQVLSYPKTKEFRARETRRILKIIIAMGVCFIVFIFPRDILQISFSFSVLYPPLLNIDNHLFINAILKVFHTANSSVNVFLYSLLNTRFRRQVIRLFMKSPYLRKLSGYTASTDNSSIYTQDTGHSRKMSEPLKSMRPTTGRKPSEQQLLRNASVGQT